MLNTAVWLFRLELLWVSEPKLLPEPEHQRFLLSVALVAAPNSKVLLPLGLRFVIQTALLLYAMVTGSLGIIRKAQCLHTVALTYHFDYFLTTLNK